MTIQLVSQHAGKAADVRLKHVSQIINESSADLVVFAGHALLYKSDISDLKKSIVNKKSSVLLETKENGNHLYRIESGRIIDMKTHQLFKRSREINKDPKLAEDLLNELEQRRRFDVKGKNCLVLQCGELNILKNYQTERNRVVFRFDNDRELESRFLDIIERVDILLNPIHSPMGNQGKLSLRRVFLSRNDRAYFSTCNASTAKALSLNRNSLQYALRDGRDLTAVESSLFGKSYIIRSYEL